MIGGAGDDTYYVYNTGDVIIENANEGTDTVASSFNYTLGANVENLTLYTYGLPVSATGNTLDNVLTGDSRGNILIGLDGNDTLNGGMDADTMIGGLGNDYYYVDSVSDFAIENANEGTDGIYSPVNYTLGSNIENLTLTGSSAINGTGNSLNNVLNGNSGNNVLNGLAGNDTYVFSLNGGSDTVTDSGADASTQDKVLFNSDVPKETVALFQSGQDLIIGYGSSDTINVTSQFQSDYGVEKLELANGLYLTTADINQVIQDINAFATSHGISLTNINDVKNNQDLMTIISNSWHS
jgi:Ca2+-binding RTX toxin-like protein